MTDTKNRRPDIIDNRKYHMHYVLNANLPDLKGLDISSGFFDVKGYNAIHKELRKKLQNPKFEFRLLLGANAIISPVKDFEEYKKQALEENMLLSHDLDQQEMNKNNRDETHNLIETLDLDNVCVKRNPNRFNHSKCYIFHSSYPGVIIGSSNFTGNGLGKNYELNAGLNQEFPYNTAKEWFDEMWNHADDIKDEIRTTLLDSKFGIPPEPFQIYAKIVFEMFKDRIKAADDRSESAMLLTKFQRDAVNTAIQIINDHDGVIIADSTGLGKTNMGMDIMRRKHFNENRKMLLIAPAQVLNSMWKIKLEDAGIVAKTESMETLGREGFLKEINKYKKYDLVVIDESQNFRSKAANRRINLMKLMSVGKKKQAVLLTATPINNSIMDLYYQLSIITGGDDAHFVDSVGIPNLYGHIRDAANRDKFQDRLEKIQQLLDTTMIRRTRSYIKEVYKDDKIDGRPIKFPDHQFASIHYSMTELYGNIFAKVKEIDRLTMAPYRIESYNTSISEPEREKIRTLGYLQRTLLLKRFESSKVAAQRSIENMIRLYGHVKVLLDEGKIPNVKELNKILNKYRNMEDDDDYSDLIDQTISKSNAIKAQSVKDYGVGAIKDDIESDLAKLNEFKESLEKIKQDKKLEAVYEKIKIDRALETGSKKVLVFTEYVTTAEYLKNEFDKLFDGSRVLLITGKTKPERRQEIIREFAPRANLAEDDVLGVPEADILISTEVLSEGQNLQDCNYVVNYDLPWNPMRIVQRIGRVDRLTSNYDVIYSRACYPAKELNAILQLLEKLIDKINIANDTVGLGEELLGVRPEDKQFNEDNIHLKLAGAGAGINDEIERLQRDSDMMLENSPLNMINELIRKEGIMVMEGMAMGRRSGIKGDGQKALLGYLQENPRRRLYFVLYDYKSGSAEVIASPADALRMISCKRETVLHLPMDSDGHKTSFDELLKIDVVARKAVKEDNEAARRSAMSLRDRKRDRLLSKIDRLSSLVMKAYNEGKMIKDDAKRLEEMLQPEYLVSWEDDLDRIFEDYKNGSDSDGLKIEIERLGNLIDVDKKSVWNDDESGSLESELKLVGAMFITGEKFDSKIGKSGLDKHI